MTASERGGFRPTLTALAVLAVMALCAALQGCAARQADDADPLPGEPLRAGTVVFRHKVKLEFPGRDVSHSFDGLMRLDTENRAILVAGVAGPGMRMFTLSITPDGETVEYLHPLLARIPSVSSHMARSIRRIWFDCLAQIPQTQNAEYAAWSLAATGKPVAGIWPETVVYVDKHVPYTITVHLVRAQQEDLP